MSQKERVLEALQNGRELTAKQITAQYGAGNPHNVVRLIRMEGYPVYLNTVTNSKGHKLNKYRLGTPTKRMVSAGIRAISAGVDDLL